MTGSSDRPRRTSPSPWPQRSADRGTASRMLGKRPCKVVNAMTPSSRASRAPRQWWMPWPKARWLVSARVMSRVCGLWYMAGLGRRLGRRRRCEQRDKPAAQLMAVWFGDAEQLADHGEWQRESEALDQVD